MATIKLQPSGAVVIKDGKVACSCCEGPSCCPYPAQALVDGLYTYEDLPDAIDIEGLEFTKLDPPQFLGGVTIYYIYPNNEDFNLEGGYSLNINDFTSGSFWASDFGQDFCLLNDATYKDQFADTYTVSGEPLGSVTLTRVSLCLWTGLDSCGNTVFLELFADPDDGRIWYLEFPHYISPCVLSETLIRSVENIGYGNTPVGGYGNEPYDEVVLFVS